MVEGINLKFKKYRVTKNVISIFTESLIKRGGGINKHNPKNTTSSRFLSKFNTILTEVGTTIQKRLAIA